MSASVRSSELRAWYRHGLSAQIDAVVAARTAIEAGDDGAGRSLRRIAHHLRRTSSQYGMPAIAATAGSLEAAADAELLPRSGELLAELEEESRRVETRQLGILVVEDDADIVLLLRARLATPNRKVYVAPDIAGAERALDTYPIDIVLLDLHLPDGDGRDLLSRIRDRTKTAQLPVFVLSTSLGTQQKTEAFALGADEYFEKPLDIETMSAALAARLQRAAEMSARLYDDPLTGLPNREAVRQEFDRLAAICRRLDSPFSLALIDLDRFKSVNDSFGHRTGDDVLQAIAGVLRKSFRPTDVVGRWGGEEFVVLLPSAGVDTATSAVERALREVAGTPLTTTDGKSLVVTFSAGVCSAGSGQDLATVVERADRFLYVAKQAGRNRVAKNEELTVTKSPTQSRLLVLSADDRTAALLERELGQLRLSAERHRQLETLLALPSVEGTICIVDLPTDGTALQLVERLTSAPELSAMIVLLLADPTRAIDIGAGLAAGADDYILKPLSAGDLALRLQLARRRTAGTSRDD